MDKEKLAYFCSRYRGLDGEGLIELNAKRDTLADEAVEALDTVFKERGVNPAVLERFASDSLPPADTKRNWGRVTGQILVTLVVVFLAKTVAPVTPHWVGLLVILGFAGYWLYTRWRKRGTGGTVAKNSAATPWTRRLVRLWLALCVPAAVYCGYQAYRSDNFIADMNVQAQFWRERIEAQKNGGLRGAFDPFEELMTRLTWARESQERRDAFFWASIGLITLPLSMWLVILVGRWVWGKTQTDDPSR